MSILSRERASDAEAEDMRQLTRPVILVRAVVPVAKTAGVAVREGARSTAAWAAPRVNGARAWTAPRLEWSGLAIRDTVGPRIYEVLTATARRVEVSAPRVDVDAPRRRWSRILAGTALLTAAGAAAAIVLRRRKDDGTSRAAGESAGTGTGPTILAAT